MRQRYEKAAGSDDREVALRLLSATAACLVLAWAIYCAVVTLAFPSEHTFSARVVFAIFSASFVIWWLPPHLMRVLGWRNIKHPRQFWLRSIFVGFYPLALFFVVSRGIPIIARWNVLVMTLLTVGGFALERRKRSAGES